MAPDTTLLNRASRRPDGHALIVLGIMTVVTAAKLLLAAHFYGFLSGDDLEVVEGAAKYALGLEYQPWSLRCLFHPVALVAPILEAGAIFGVKDALSVAWMAALPTIIASTATVWLIFRLSCLLGLPGRGTARHCSREASGLQAATRSSRVDRGRLLAFCIQGIPLPASRDTAARNPDGAWVRPASWRIAKVATDGRVDRACCGPALGRATDDFIATRQITVRRRCRPFHQNARPSAGLARAELGIWRKTHSRQRHPDTRP